AERGEPGTLLAFYEWPDVHKGQWGVGGVHHVALSVATAEAQLQWKRWLSAHGVGVSGPFNRGYFRSIYFRDPDGHILEIATEGPGYAVDEPAEALGRRDVTPPQAELRDRRDEVVIAARNWPEPVREISDPMRLTGIHHVSAITDDLERMDDFLTATLGLTLIKRTFNQDARDTRHWFWGTYDGHTVSPHSSFSAFGWPGSEFQARAGTGQVHHVAFRAADDEEQLAWRDRLESLGIGVSGPFNRGHFRSMYFTAPDGLLLEIATDVPGFGEEALDSEALSAKR
ncbi:MAG TPA: VOC family protein, partial [Gemmatimonadales bacterium]|nr:VOC family protein [Gemmatimonadales bacterium]